MSPCTLRKPTQKTSAQLTAIEQDLGCLLLFTIQMFADARSFISNPVARAELVVLKEVILRNEFFQRSRLIDEESTAVAEPPAPSDQNVPEGQGSSLAPRGTFKEAKQTCSQSSTNSSSSSSSTLYIVESPREPENMANIETIPTMKSQKSKRRNPKKREATGEPTSQENLQKHSEEHVDQEAESAPISTNTAVNPSVPEPPSVVSAADTIESAPAAPQTPTAYLPEDLTARPHFAPPNFNTPSSVQPQSRAREDTQRSRGQDAVRKEDLTPVTSLPARPNSAPHLSTAPTLPPQSSRKHSGKRRATRPDPSLSDTHRQKSRDESNHITATHPTLPNPLAARPQSPRRRTAQPRGLPARPIHPLRNSTLATESSVEVEGTAQLSETEKGDQQPQEAVKNPEVSRLVPCHHHFTDSP